MGEGSLAKPLRHLAAEADVVLLVGTRTNQNGTDSWSLFGKNAKFIHVDVDGVEVGRNYEALRLVGDARLTLEQMADACRGLELGPREQAGKGLVTEIAAAKEKFGAALADFTPGRSGAIRPEYLMRQIDLRLREGDVVVGDASYASNWVATYVTARGSGMRILTPRGLAGLGWGVPMAMGAKLARPDARVVAVVGDGGFAHCWSELETLRREGIDVLTVVLHNKILGYQQHAENVQYGNHTTACRLTDVDHAAIARACGCNGIRVEDPAAIRGALDTWFRDGGPTLLDVSIDPDAYPPLTLYEGKQPLTAAALHIVA
jgi:acetolactate synthase-1/2/3 large subunit